MKSNKSDETTIVFIRHLQTSYNKKGLLQGSLDISIEPPSLKDFILIQSNITCLNNFKFDKVFCSGLKRTHETAVIYGYKDPIHEPMLNELNFGSFEGKSKEIFKNQEEYCLWLNNPSELILGESLSGFFSRIDSFIKKNKNLCCLAFSHGAVLRYVMAKHIMHDVSTMNHIHIDNNAMFCLTL